MISGGHYGAVLTAFYSAGIIARAGICRGFFGYGFSADRQMDLDFVCRLQSVRGLDKINSSLAFLFPVFVQTPRLHQMRKQGFSAADVPRWKGNPEPPGAGIERTGKPFSDKGVNRSK